MDLSSYIVINNACVCTGLLLCFVLYAHYSNASHAQRLAKATSVATESPPAPPPPRNNVKSACKSIRILDSIIDDNACARERLHTRTPSSRAALCLC